MQRARIASLLGAALITVGCTAHPNAAGDGGPDGSLDGSSGAAGDAGDGGSAADGGDGGSPGDAGDGGSTSDAGAPHDDCSDGPTVCAGAFTLEACVQTPGGRRLEQLSCDAGSGCFQGACVPGRCSDDCSLFSSDGGACAAVDAVSRQATPLDAAGSLHDRSRAYLGWLHRDALAFGGVGSARYADPGTWAVPLSLDGIGDSAIWTGTLLAAESLRLLDTGSADARAHVRAGAQTLHLWMNVTGSPGMLARFARPAGAALPVTLPDLDCGAGFRQHCGVSFANALYDYLGDTSRDMYVGAMLGLSLAFDALGAGDEDVRAPLVQDVVTFVEELMKDRSLPVHITVHFAPITVLGLGTIDSYDAHTTMTLTNVVVNPAEWVNGEVVVDLNTQNAGDGSTIQGLTEFMPDLNPLLQGTPLPSYLTFLKQTPLPRPDSAIMLLSFLHVAMHASEGRAGLDADRNSIVGYYGGHVDSFLAKAATWTETNACGEAYYGNNLAVTPMYDLVRLEDDAARLTGLRALFTDRLWPVFVNTKNSYFSYLYAGVVPSAEASVAAMAGVQLAQFPPPPRVLTGADLRGNPSYPESSSCAGQVDHATALDVAVRAPSEFLWQSDPWELYRAPDLSQTGPGVDYLAAYWLGRHGGFLADDASARCLARQ